MPPKPSDYIKGEIPRMKQAENLGREKSFFAQMKALSPDLYEYIYNFKSIIMPRTITAHFR